MHKARSQTDHLVDTRTLQACFFFFFLFFNGAVKIAALSLHITLNVAYTSTSISRTATVKLFTFTLYRIKPPPPPRPPPSASALLHKKSNMKPCSLSTPSLCICRFLGNDFALAISRFNTFLPVSSVRVKIVHIKRSGQKCSIAFVWTSWSDILV